MNEGRLKEARNTEEVRCDRKCNSKEFRRALYTLKGILKILILCGGFGTRLSGVNIRKGGMSVLEVVFVGQCEVFVCLDFVGFFFFFFFFSPLATNGMSILLKKMSIFPTSTP